jgi:hypothetical protein
MRTNELDDKELGVLMVALKYWRAHRQESETRRTDAALTGETLDLLVAKLDEASLAPMPSDRDIIFHHHLLNDFDPRKHH